MNNAKNRAREAIDRIFDYCQPIDYSEYSMLDDYFAVSDFLNKRHEAKWELLYHDDQPSYYAHYVTARCSKCKNWFYGNENHMGYKDDKYGAKLWAAFCTNYNEDVRNIFKWTALDSAEKELNKSNDLPIFCCHCGARMRGIEMSLDECAKPWYGRK